MTLNPGQTKNAHLTHNIPTAAPLGTYTYYGQVGAYPAVVDSGSFQFSVTTTLNSQTTPQSERLLIGNGFKE